MELLDTHKFHYTASDNATQIFTVCYIQEKFSVLAMIMAASYIFRF